MFYKNILQFNFICRSRGARAILRPDLKTTFKELLIVSRDRFQFILKSFEITFQNCSFFNKKQYRCNESLNCYGSLEMEIL